MLDDRFKLAKALVQNQTGFVPTSFLMSIASARHYLGLLPTEPFPVLEHKDYHITVNLDSQTVAFDFKESK